MALRLKARGITNVRPLAGGLNEWRARGYPVEFRGPRVAPDRTVLNAA